MALVSKSASEHRSRAFNLVFVVAVEDRETSFVVALHNALRMNLGRDSDIIDFAAFEDQNTDIGHNADMLKRLGEGLNKQNKARETIFIAYKVGGVILKQALLSASNEGFDGWMSNVTKLFFIATPHRAMYLRQWRETFLATTTLTLPRSFPNLYRALEELSENSLLVSHDFYEIVENFHIINIFGGSLMLNEDRAIPDVCWATLGISNEVHILVDIGLETSEETKQGTKDNGIDRLSRKIVSTLEKFAHDDDSLYRECITHLLASSQITHGSTLPSLRTPSENKPLTDLAPDCSAWLSSTTDNSALHIYRSSQSENFILSMIMQSIEASHFQGGRIILTYACIKHDHRRCSTSNLLFSFLHQLFWQSPPLFWRIRPMYQSLRDRGIWTVHDLMVLFRLAVKYQGKNNVLCAIDNADYLNPIEDFDALKVIFQSGAKLIIGTQSSPPKGFGFPTTEMEFLDHVLQSNIVSSLKHEISSLVGWQPALVDSQEIIASSLTKSTKYHWATLNIDFLQSKPLLSPQSLVRNETELLPRKPDDIFNEVLRKITPSLSEWAHAALSWILHSARPLRLTELVVALAVSSLDSWVLNEGTREPPPWHEFAPRYIIQDLKGLFGVMVRIEMESVSLVGKSARDFLINRMSEEHLSGKSLGHESHESLAKNCKTYLLLYDKYQSESQGNIPSSPRIGNFLMYALEYWPYHYNLAPNISPDIFIEGGFLTTQHRLRVFHGLSLLSCLASPIAIAADLGVERLVADLRTKIRPKPEDLDVALNVAADRGFEAIVRLLQSDRTGDEASAISLGRYAIHNATKRGYNNIARHLLTSEKHPYTTKDDKGLTPMRYAARTGNVSLVEALFEKIRSQNLEEADPLALLADAAAAGHVVVVHRLLKYINDRKIIDEKTHKDSTSLCLATWFGHVDVVEALLDVGMNISQKQEPLGTSPLLEAIRGEHFDILLMFVERAISKNSAVLTKEILNQITKLEKPSNHKTLELFGASRERFIDSIAKKIKTSDNLENEMLDMLLKAVPVGKFTNWSGIYLAIKNSNDRRGQILLEAGVPLNEERDLLLREAIIKGLRRCARALACFGVDWDADTNLSPLHLASEKGEKEIVRDLCELGLQLKTKINKGENDMAKPKADDDSGDLKLEFKITPLHLASQYNHQEVVTLLLTKGYHIDSTDSLGNTPLHFAAVAGHIDLVKTLLKKGARKNKVNTCDETPIYLASYWGNVEVVRELVAEYPLADIEHKSNARGWTPLHAAHDNKEITDILLNAGCNVNATSSQQETALILACQAGEADVVASLLNKDADVNARDSVQRNALSHAVYNAIGGPEESVALGIIEGLLASNADITALPAELRHTILEKIFHSRVNKTSALSKALLAACTAKECLLQIRRLSVERRSQQLELVLKYGNLNLTEVADIFKALSISVQSPHPEIWEKFQGSVPMVMQFLDSDNWNLDTLLSQSNNDYFVQKRKLLWSNSPEKKAETQPPTKFLAASTSNQTKISIEDQKIMYSSESSQHQVQTFKADHPLAPCGKGVSYFEFKVAKYAQQEWAVRYPAAAIGLCGEFTDLDDSMPGWKKQSIGYHGDDGGIYVDDGTKCLVTKPPFSVGAVIGCGVDWTKGECYFINGGVKIYVHKSREFTSRKLYPVIGIANGKELCLEARFHMKFRTKDQTPELNLDPLTPIRVSVHAPFHILSELHPAPYDRAPSPDGTYIENTAAIELARQLYSNLFKPISTLEILPLVVRGVYTSTKYYPADGPASAPDEEDYGAYNITFDHLVGDAMRDPDAVELFVDEDTESGLNITWMKSGKATQNINEAVRKFAVERDVMDASSTVTKIST